MGRCTVRRWVASTPLSGLLEALCSLQAGLFEIAASGNELFLVQVADQETTHLQTIHR